MYTHVNPIFTIPKCELSGSQLHGRVSMMEILLPALALGEVCGPQSVTSILLSEYVHGFPDESTK